MKINTAILQNLSKEKYLAYIRSFPDFRNEKVQSYATAILTMLAICIFGIFAIAPTLGTISQLKKSLQDSKFLDEQLQTKITNMSRLQDAYNIITPQLPLLFAAVPKTPNPGNISGEIRAVVETSHLNLLQLDVKSVELAAAKKTPNALSPIMINLSVQGNITDFEKFLNTLISMDRLLTIDSASLSTIKTQTGTLYQLNVQAQAYYRP